MTTAKPNRRIKWYRSPLTRDQLAMLNQRSDWKGLRQTLGHLGLLLITGTSAWVAADNSSWGLFFLILFFHGTIYHFLLNGFHELCHSSVFESKFLNEFFLHVFSFLGIFNPIHFWASHQEHHKYTLHPPDDLEVVFPFHLPFKGFLQSVIINPWGMYQRFKGLIQTSLGQLEGEWTLALFPESDPKKRRRLINYSRFLLIAHLLIVVVSFSLGYWQIPVLVTFAPFYGGWLLYLCNNTQHVGLQDDVADYRLCTRTIILNPVVRFLYWHMNYHIEHHMYAAVPCYNLHKLHEIIEDDLPPSTVGLYATWMQIIQIVKRQKIDPDYQYVPELPTPSKA